MLMKLYGARYDGICAFFGPVHGYHEKLVRGDVVMFIEKHHEAYKSSAALTRNGIRWIFFNESFDLID